MNIDVFNCFDVKFEDALISAYSIDFRKPMEENPDATQYFLCGCVWFSILNEWSNLVDFLAYVKENGLFKAIDIASHLSKDLIDRRLDLFETYPVEFQSVLYDWVDNLYTEPSDDDLATIASILRYPKRFCCENNSLKDSCIKEFLDHNELLGMQSGIIESEMARLNTTALNLSQEFEQICLNYRPCYTQHHRIWSMPNFESATGNNALRVITINHMREHILNIIGASPWTLWTDPPVEPSYRKDGQLTKKFLDYQEILNEERKLKAVMLEEDILSIPTGVCADAHSFYGKVSEIIKRNPLKYPGHPLLLNEELGRKISGIDRSIKLDLEFNLDNAPFKYISNYVHYGEVMAVPKTYEEYRIVVKEQSYRLAASKKLANYVAESLKVKSNGAVNVEDQSINRERARIGSIDGSLATIDWKHASDCYSTLIAKELLPLEWFKAIDTLRSRYLLDPSGRLHFNHIFLTMGHTLTPSIQSLFFYALILSAVDIAKEYFGITCDSSACSVYNDDTVVPSEIVELVEQMGSSIGLVMNNSKTYAKGSFREACGGEWQNGTTYGIHLYWPRKRIDIITNRDFIRHYETLISIQHSVMNHRAASDGMCEFLQCHIKNMTWSTTMSEGTTDLIRRFRSVTVVAPPHDESITDDEAIRLGGSREVHLSVVGTWPRTRECPKERLALAEYYVYQQYLKEGPSYDEPILELLHCSSRRRVDALVYDLVPQLSRKRS